MVSMPRSACVLRPGSVVPFSSSMSMSMMVPRDSPLRLLRRLGVSVSEASGSSWS